MADKIGRRPVLLCGIIGTMFSCLLFGFSWNFWMALAARFLWGLLNGNIGVSKVYIGEVLDDTNSARGMSVYGVIGGVGRIIGPLLGGFLSSPAKTFTFMKGTIFETFPYCLPQILLAFGCLLMLILAYFQLPETEAFITMQKNKIELQLQDNSTKRDKVAVINPLQSLYDKVNTNEEMIDTKSINNDDDNNSTNYGSKKRVTFSGIVTVKVIDSNALAYSRLKQLDTNDEPVIDLECESNESGARQIPRVPIRYDNGSRLIINDSQSTYRYIVNIFTQREVLVTTILYGLNAYCQIILNEVFPLWVVTSKSDGGFDFNTQNIGTVILFSGPISIFAQLVLYPKITDNYGVLKVYKIAAYSFGVMIILLPMVSFISQYNIPLLSGVVIWFSLSILTVTGQWILISLFVLINNSCYTNDRGVVNGIGQSFASFARFLGPSSGGNMFAWSENNNLPWPLNYHFVFILIGIMSILNAIISYTLPISIQKSKKIITSEQNNVFGLTNSKQSTISKYTIINTNDDDENNNAVELTNSKQSTISKYTIINTNDDDENNNSNNGDSTDFDPKNIV